MSVQYIKPCLKPVTGQSLRSFSTIPLKFSNRVPPESPSYIRLPTPPQYEEKKRERVRGSLPIPREIFPRLEGDRKVQKEYMDRTAAPPSKQPKIDTKEQLWKYQMSKQRRGNLRTGLRELWQRKTETDKIHNDRTKAKFNAHRAAAHAPEREDDRLTRGTVLGSLLDTKVHLDPKRFVKADKARSKVIATEEAKKEARRDALMELYISASNFITDEAGLKKEIEEVFSEDYFKSQSQAAGRWGANNAWGIYGRPPSISNMLDSTKGLSTKLVDVNESEYDRSVKRQKRIAEEFTGGKME